MFCSNCGAEARGNFCSKCGSPLTESPPASEAPPASEEIVQDWSRETRYEKLIRVPEVRDMIDRHAAMNGKRLSGEEFLAFCDKVIPLGFPLAKLVTSAQTLNTRLGIKTGKQRSETLETPPGAVMVAALCSFARNGQTIRRASQLDDGCLLETTLPSDVWTLEGSLHLSVRQAGAGTLVEAATTIQGQLFDWGKSKRCLEELFRDLRALPA